MNKKFSTLLVSALLASGAAFTAQADDYKPGQGVDASGKPDGTVKVGVNAFLKLGDDFLGLEDGKLTIVSDADKSVAGLQE